MKQGHEKRECGYGYGTREPLIIPIIHDMHEKMRNICASITCGTHKTSPSRGIIEYLGQALSNAVALEIADDALCLQSNS